MIIISQGHEKGIGLEVFFKSVLVSDSKLSKSIKLIAFKESVKTTLNSLRIPYLLEKDSLHLAHKSISVEWMEKCRTSESFDCLERAMEICESGDHVLFTLPTSKDQFPGFSGHTEYFRHKFQLPELGMFFLSKDLKVLLLSDHIPLRDVPNISSDVFYERISTALTQFRLWNWKISNVMVAGINPHAGEGGLIGNEDDKLKSAIIKLNKKSSLKILGPIPADTMQLMQTSKTDILIYPYHDQGLGIFKSLQGFIGANITLGLTYPRFSPDHGTSFPLFGKNKADYRGCAYALKEAFILLESLYGRNSRIKSKSSQP